MSKENWLNTWGVAVKTRIDIGGIAVSCDGSLANKEASILFCSQSLLLGAFDPELPVEPGPPPFPPPPDDDTWCEPSIVLLTAKFSSPSSPCLLWPTWDWLPWQWSTDCEGGGGVGLRNPRLINKGSSSRFWKKKKKEKANINFQ